MPAYDFRCRDCRHTFTQRYASYEEVDQVEPACPKCGSTQLSKLIRRVSFMMGEEAHMERLADPSRLGGLDEDDPRALGRMMREVASASGEDMGSEFGEIVDRLEAGESPDSIEESMPSLGASDSAADL